MCYRLEKGERDAMKLITMHWTAGTYNASKTDLLHYHFVVNGLGDVITGRFDPEDNLDTSTPYAAHTKGANTGNIGIAIAGMRGAKQKPFSAGNYPIKAVQVNAMVEKVADLCIKYGIPVTPKTVLTHAEVQPHLGIKQRGKWDINWLPEMRDYKSSYDVGDALRYWIQEAVQKKQKKKRSFWAVLAKLLKGVKK